MVPRPALSPWTLAFVAFVACAAFAFVAIVSGSTLVLVLALLLLGCGVVLAARGAMRLCALAGRGEPVPARTWALTVVGLVAGPLFALLGAALALMASMAFARGRQIRHRGRVMLPPLGDVGSWTQPGLKSSAPAGLRRGLAARWRENGRTEHASVAAFARLALDLVALGAPPRMVAAAHRDALDEIRHAELCFGLARSLDGEERGPLAFPEATRSAGPARPRTLALARLAVDSLVDGALNEGVSARVLARLAKRCDDVSARAVLLELASDEGRHCAHGWDVVLWCAEQGGPPVVHALRGAAAVLPKRLKPPADGARDGSWERHGIPGAELEAEEYARAREHVRSRVAALAA